MKFVTMNAVAQFKQNEWENVHVIKYTGTNSFHSTYKHITSQTFVIMLNFNNIKYTACFESTLLCEKLPESTVFFVCLIFLYGI